MSHRVEQRIGIRATADRIWDIVADLPGWSAWNPVLVDAEGVIAIGGALSMTERIEGRPERRVSARINDWVPYTQLIWSERRGWHFNSTRYIEIEELAPGSSIVTIGEIFGGFRGEDYVYKHHRTLRRACEAMGEALRGQAEAP